MSIFEYKDYRLYLVHFWKMKKQKNPKYSLRAWAKKLGIDNTLFHKILKGSRKFPPEKIVRVAQGLELTSFETEYFQLMIDYDQCANKKLKGIILQEMLALKVQAQTKELSSEEFVKFDFYDAVLMEMTNIPTLDFSASNLSQKINLSPNDIQNRLKRLVQLGFLQFENGIYSKSTQKLKYKINLDQAELSRYLKEVNHQSNRHIDLGSPHRRAFRTRVVSISRDKGPLFAQMLDRFMRQLDEAFQDDKPKETTVCLNMQFFPLWED